MQECHTALCLSVYLITFLTGLPANAVAFYTFSKKVRQKPTPIDILLLNLTISDLLFLLFLPFKMQEVTAHMAWNLPYILCPVSSFIFYMTIYVSTFFLTAVSVERYLGVAFPIQHSLKRRPLYAVAASVFIWVFSVLQLSIVIIMPFYNPSQDSVSSTTNSSSGYLSTNFNGSIRDTDHIVSSRNVCYEDFSKEQLEILLPVRLELCLVLFCVPFLICSFCYINFIRILSGLPHIGRRRRLRAIGLALGTLLVFAFCFGPYNISHIVGFITGKNPDWRDMALLCSTFNACLDPFIFYFSSAAVRGTLGSLLKGARIRMAKCVHCGCHNLWFPQKGLRKPPKEMRSTQVENNAI
ncbi:free fatty acid receptor 2 [Esox lucius]|uniref:free fatty acid receptor 2 n=1 Tax=Esox lucius TaxID=8010 RepID=UPI00057687B9|nr:free fatty acid receptor 2 [Esox lucius]XP_010897731.1 free fatty acid receptor 2 [Esox lucius]